MGTWKNRIAFEAGRMPALPGALRAWLLGLEAGRMPALPGALRAWLLGLEAGGTLALLRFAIRATSFPTYWPGFHGALSAWFLTLVLLTSCLPSFAQEPAQDNSVPILQKRAYTLNEVVDIAVKSYPTIRRVAMEKRRATHEITLAKTQYLPRIDGLYQQMQATQNPVDGTILPQFLNVIPIQSGSVRNSSTFSSVFGTNAGVNCSWELIDFGKRAANVKVARSVVGSRTAQERLTELDVAARAADSYLKLVMAQQQIEAYKAVLVRMQDWALVVHTLCDKGLKPGVDAARSDAEVSMAKIELVDAERDAELAEQDLAEAMGHAGMMIDTISGALLTRKSVSDAAPELRHFKPIQTPTADSPALRGGAFVIDQDLYKHPLALLRMSDVDVAKARLHLLERTWYPHLWYESAIWGRGSGKRGTIKPVADGVVPSTGNWAVGFTLQFPFMDYFKVKAQKNIERAQIETEQASYNLAMQELIKQDEKAKILLKRAKQVADETPVLVNAAKQNEKMAVERYRVGLTNVIEVAQAERILARAQVADAVAQLKVWQAMLSTAYAHGDLKPFLTLVASAGGNK